MTCIFLQERKLLSTISEFGNKFAAHQHCKVEKKEEKEEKKSHACAIQGDFVENLFETFFPCPLMS